jgi:hypothetical protein
MNTNPSFVRKIHEQDASLAPQTRRSSGLNRPRRQFALRCDTLSEPTSREIDLLLHFKAENGAAFDGQTCVLPQP